MIDLYTAGTPNGWKVSIMLEELREAGVILPPLEVRTVDLREEQFSATFTAINPNQKIPALVHGDLALMESCAILSYLGETFPTDLLPSNQDKWRVLQWVYWQAANLGPVFGNKLSYTRYMDDVDPVEKAHPLERFGKEARRLLGVFSKQLSRRPFLCGEQFTIADIACYPWLRGWKWSKIDVTGHPNVVDWISRVRARPAVARGLKYGMPEAEVDQWTPETKARYAQLGASIAGNDTSGRPDGATGD